MKSEAQRIAIAEACPDLFTVVNEDAPCSIIYRRNAQVVDLLMDLNAMHEAEMALNRKHCLEYVTELGYVVGNTGVEYYDLIRATAAQRAEAFLKAIGKWES